MNTNIHLKKWCFIALALIFLALLIFVIWHFVIPGYVAREVLGKFEDACYAGNPDKIMKLVYSQAPYYDICNKICKKDNCSGLQKLFNKFQRGFRIIKVRHGFEFLPGDESRRRQIILISRSKIAKIDGKERSMTSELAKIDGEWKIMYYYFQDYIDY